MSFPPPPLEFSGKATGKISHTRISDCAAFVGMIALVIKL
jgi:hypothetical protein